MEQQRSVVEDVQQDHMPDSPPLDANVADLAEQHAAVPGDQERPPASLPTNANAADALEQRQLVPVDDEDHRR
ncbi:hypothetical protein BG844_28395 [Couchioplanes caeruleus subsp. caeruleus]|uniref:Uncharacterized protein n=2 Tax=Couchioplanes caeruleus TaxID=56438 RepID=A0A1K0GJK7_9ACTN|nr:hypothetical protein BG844_28395 [Couchioplanes caeruleus subsp. caeruleus]